MKHLNFYQNSNGDTYQTLMDQQRKIINATDDLLAALAEARPHGRNYQTLKDAQEKLEADREQYAEFGEQVQKMAEFTTNSMLKLYGDKEK